MTDLFKVIMGSAVILACLAIVVERIVAIRAVRAGTKRFLRGMDELDRRQAELERASRLDE